MIAALLAALLSVAPAQASRCEYIFGEQLPPVCFGPGFVPPQDGIAGWYQSPSLESPNHTWANAVEGGSAADFTQATEDERPTLQVVNGRVAYVFDGVNDTMPGGCLPDATHTEMSLFIVHKPLSPAGNARWLGGGFFGLETGAVYSFSAPIPFGYEAMSETLANDSHPALTTLVLNYDTDVYVSRLNGATENTDTTARTNAPTNGGLSLAGTNGVTWMHAAFFEILCYTVAVDDAARDYIEAYAKARYGID